MTVHTDPSVEEPGGTPPPPRRRRLLALVGLLVVLAVAVTLVVLLRGDGADTGEETAPSVTTAGGATPNSEPPLGSLPPLTLDVEGGPPGSEVRLDGIAFKQGKDFGPIDLFWDQVGGQKLLTVDGPRFSVKLTIPADAPVLTEGHNIIAVQRTTAGEIAIQRSIRFFVLPPRP